MCVTTSSEILASEARALTREIEAGLLDYASAEARDEWSAFCRRWSPDVVATVPVLSADEPFESIVDRMRRFHSILKARSAQETLVA